MRNLVITDAAKADLEEIALFLKQAYSDRVKTDFLADFAKRLLLIEQMPFMYQASAQNPAVRRCLIPKHTACFYEVTDTLILILAVVDTRSDADALRL
jgi:plasmid stabilization system protein ParE